MTAQQQKYDPYQLVDDVIALLRASGLSPSVGSIGEALGAAGQLLRSLDIEALLDPVEGFTRANAHIWSDEGDKP
jgi:hypothetical protein